MMYPAQLKIEVGQWESSVFVIANLLPLMIDLFLTFFHNFSSSCGSQQRESKVHLCSY